MIEQLIIQNYQKHKKQIINFGPGITTILGDTDKGKSAILRALQWVAMNVPGGEDFINWEAPGATVKIKLDGHTVGRRRSRGGSVNEYSFDGQVYKAFGRGVPEPIADFLRIGPLCVQGQHDAAYWFSKTAGQVSRDLNAIVDLGIIDDTLADVARTVHKTRTRLEVAEENLTTTKTECNRLDWVPDFTDALEHVEAAEKRSAKTSSQTRLLVTLLEDMSYQRAREKHAASIRLAGLAVLEHGDQAIALEKRSKLLKTLLQSVADCREAARQKVPSFEEMDTALNEYHLHTKAAANLQALISDIQTKETILCSAEETKKQAEQAVPKTCPTCGRFS